MSISKNSASDFLNINNKLDDIDSLHNVPSINNTDNAFLRDIIGNKNDFISVPYSLYVSTIMAHLNTAYFHVHGRSFAYPEIGPAVDVVSGTGSWGTGGAITEIIPAGQLSVADFDLHWIDMIAPSEDAQYYIEIYGGGVGAEVKIGYSRTWRNSSVAGGQIGITTRGVQVPQQLVNTRISCKLYSSNAGTALVKIAFSGHYYSL